MARRDLLLVILTCGLHLLRIAATVRHYFSLVTHWFLVGCLLLALSWESHGMLVACTFEVARVELIPGCSLIGEG